MKNAPQDPKSAEEWQEAVDVAQFLIALESCKMYGLITGGPEANQERCLDIIWRGQQIGIRPAPLEQLAKKFL